MKTTVVVRRLDEQGRLVIPKNMRLKYDIFEGDDVEIFDDGEKIVISKYRPKCVFCSGTDKLLMFNGKCICERCRNILAAPERKSIKG